MSDARLMLESHGEFEICGAITLVQFFDKTGITSKPIWCFNSSRMKSKTAGIRGPLLSFISRNACLNVVEELERGRSSDFIP